MNTTDTTADSLTPGELDARLRAKYEKQIQEWRETWGEEPSLGTVIAAEWRAKCNNWTDEEREEIHARGMDYYRNLISNQSHAHAIRS